MKRNRLFAPLAALLLVAAAPVTSPFTAPGFGKQIAAAAALLDDNRVNEALNTLDTMLLATELPMERGQIEALRSFALARLNRIPEAHKAIEAGVASNPDPSLLLLRQLFLLRAFDGDAAGAADTIQLIAASSPDQLKQLPTEVITDVMGAIRNDANRSYELDYALNAANWQPADATLEDVDRLRLRLIMALVKRDRLDDARPVFDAVLSPVVLARLGIDRRFAPLWPQVEKRLGPGADIADAIAIAAAKARFDAAPNSLVARLGYAEALNIASREAEAAALLDVATTPAALAALTEREVWLVNLHAALLGDLGQIDAALARYAALIATPVNGRSAVVATMLNAALFAESVDRPEAALAAVAAAEAGPGGRNDYVKLYLAQVRSCVLQQQGKPAEALAAAAPLLARPGDNDDAYLTAMVCLGRTDAAAKAIIARLDNPDTRLEMLFELQPFLIADRAVVRGARERAGLRALKARPDVRAAFLKWGRDLPAAVSPPR